MHKAITEHEPRAVIVDPLTNMADAGSKQDGTRMLLRLVDHLKAKQVTALFTSLTRAGDALESPTRTSAPSWMRGCSCATWRPAVSATA